MEYVMTSTESKHFTDINYCCCVIGCDSSTEKLQIHYNQVCPEHRILFAECACTPPYTFFTFPRGVRSRTQWLQLINRCDNNVKNSLYQITSKSRICSRHFLSCDINGVPLLKLGYEHPLSDTAKSLVYDKRLMPPLVQKVPSKNPTEEEESLLPDLDVFAKSRHCYGCKNMRLDTFTLLSSECQLAKILDKICVIMSIKTIPDYMRDRQICRDCMMTVNKSFSIVSNIVDPDQKLPLKVTTDVSEQATPGIRETPITEIPSTDGSGMPSTNKTEKPSTEGTKIPSNDGTEIHVTDGTGVPSTDGTVIPSTDGTEVPSTDGTGVPGTEGTKIPRTDGTEVPSTDGTGIPSTDGTGIPSMEERAAGIRRCHSYAASPPPTLQRQRFITSNKPNVHDVIVQRVSDDSSCSEGPQPDIGVGRDLIPLSVKSLLTEGYSNDGIAMKDGSYEDEDDSGHDVSMTTVPDDGTMGIITTRASAPGYHSYRPMPLSKLDATLKSEELENAEQIFKCLVCHLIFPRKVLAQTHIVTAHYNIQIKKANPELESQSSERCRETSNSELINKEICKESSTFEAMNDSDSEKAVLETDDDVIMPEVGTNECSDGNTSKRMSKVSIKTEKSTTDVKCYTCSECHVSFQLYRNMKIHFKRRHGNTPSPKYRTCPICYRKVAHQYEHHVSRCKIKCYICNKTFLSRNYLRIHMRIHSREPHLCAQCGVQFNSPWTLKEHLMRLHTGEKPYECKICQERFITSDELTLHTGQKHTGEKPYTCDHCPETYTAWKSLKTHLLTEHEHCGEPSRGQNCTICGANFPIKVPNSHMNSHKPEHGKYQCKNCHLYFKTTLKLDRHNMLMRHGAEDSKREDDDKKMDQTAQVMSVVRDLKVQVVRASTSDAC